MFRTLVAPLDGSALAERVLPYAVRLTRAAQGRLILMRAALAAPPRTWDGSEWEQDQSASIAEAERYLRQIADPLSARVRVETVVAYGRAAAQIMDTVDRFDADGVIMATHGRTGLPHLLYGSVTEAVLANSPTPVFVVYARPGEAPAPAFSLTLARMLVPQDGSAYDAPALRMALDMLGTCGQIVLVSVVPPVRHLPRAASSHVLAYADQQEESRWQAARDYLNRIADALRSRPVPVDVKVDVRMGDPAGGIALASIEQGADLIVMATHGLTGIRRAVLGSVAGGVLRSTPTPVLLVHPTRPASVSAGPALPATLP